MQIKFYGTGGLFLVLGVMIRYRRARRRFYRRNAAGKEAFSSYDNALIVNWLETMAALLSNLFLVIGLILILMGYWKGKESRKKQPTTGCCHSIFRSS